MSLFSSLSQPPLNPNSIIPSSGILFYSPTLLFSQDQSSTTFDAIGKPFKVKTREGILIATLSASVPQISLEEMRINDHFALKRNELPEAKKQRIHQIIQANILRRDTGLSLLGGMPIPRPNNTGVLFGQLNSSTGGLFSNTTLSPIKTIAEPPSFTPGITLSTPTPQLSADTSGNPALNSNTVLGQDSLFFGPGTTVNPFLTELQAKNSTSNSTVPGMFTSLPLLPSQPQIGSTNSTSAPGEPQQSTGTLFLNQNRKESPGSGSTQNQENSQSILLTDLTQTHAGNNNPQIPTVEGSRSKGSIFELVIPKKNQAAISESKQLESRGSTEQRDRAIAGPGAKFVPVKAGSFSQEMNKMLFVSSFADLLEEHCMDFPEDVFDNTDFMSQLFAFFGKYNVNLPQSSVPRFKIQNKVILSSVPVSHSQNEKPKQSENGEIPSDSEEESKSREGENSENKRGDLKEFNKVGEDSEHVSKQQQDTGERESSEAEVIDLGEDKEKGHNNSEGEGEK